MFDKVSFSSQNKVSTPEVEESTHGVKIVGATNPLMAEEWMKKLDAIFEVIRVTEEQKLSLATFLLQCETQNWWEAMRRMMNAQPRRVPITWQQFVDIFNEQYFLRIYRTQKEQEFITLK